MDTQWRSIPRRVTVVALVMLAVAGFTTLLAPPAAAATIRPTEVESPIERGGADLGALR